MDIDLRRLGLGLALPAAAGSHRSCQYTQHTKQHVTFQTLTLLALPCLTSIIDNALIINITFCTNITQSVSYHIIFVHIIIPVN